MSGFIAESSHLHSLNLGKRIFLDTKSKFVIMLLLSIIISFIASPIKLALLMIYALIFGILIRPNLKNLLIKIVAASPFLLALSITLLISQTPQFYQTILGIYIFQGKEEFIFFQLVKSYCLVFLILSFIESEESSLNLVFVLDDFHVPKTFTAVIFVVLHQLTIIQDEFQRILIAQYSRSFNKPKYFSFSYLKLTGNILGGAIVRGLYRANNLADALKNRNFKQSFPHEKLKWTKKGILAIFVTICWIGILFG